MMVATRRRRRRRRWSAIHTTIKQITGRGVVDGNNYDDNYDEGSGHDKNDKDG